MTSRREELLRYGERRLHRPARLERATVENLHRRSVFAPGLLTRVNCTAG